MDSRSDHQAAYWNQVADQIRETNRSAEGLVGYHSPYDVHVRERAVELLDRIVPAVPNKACIAELGSGTGLNLRYFTKFKPQRLIAFDCASHLLDLARANLASVENVDFVQTSGFDLPVPQGASIDLLVTVTVLQHITDPDMFKSVVASMMASNAKYILVIEDTSRTARPVTPDYTLRSPEDYVSAFATGRYTLEEAEFVSLNWAARLFGVINRLSGLYRRHEGAAVSKPVVAAARIFSPIARFLDTHLPGSFGMSAALFRLK